MESEHEQSLILEEADSFHSEFEALAAFPNVQNLTTCSCRGYCLCEKGAGIFVHARVSETIVRRLVAMETHIRLV
jgi:hypothetical protein